MSRAKLGWSRKNSTAIPASSLFRSAVLSAWMSANNAARDRGRRFDRTHPCKQWRKARPERRAVFLFDGHDIENIGSCR